jgi:hypothetical protein
LSSDGDFIVVQSAMYALYKLALWPDGAQAILDATTLDRITQFLESPNANVRCWTCHTVGGLAIHQSTAVALLAVKPSPKLVDLLRRVSTFRAFTMDLILE